MRRVNELPKSKMRRLKKEINRCDVEIERLLGTGIPQEYMKFTKQKQRKSDKLKWMERWHGKLS